MHTYFCSKVYNNTEYNLNAEIKGEDSLVTAVGD